MECTSARKTLRRACATTASSSMFVLARTPKFPSSIRTTPANSPGQFASTVATPVTSKSLESRLMRHRESTTRSENCTTHAELSVKQSARPTKLLLLQQAQLPRSNRARKRTKKSWRMSTTTRTILSNKRPHSFDTRRPSHGIWKISRTRTLGLEHTRSLCLRLVSC